MAKSPIAQALMRDWTKSKEESVREMGYGILSFHKPALRKAALAAADRIGDVAVDHGETFCKTPEAVAYIKKASQRNVIL